MKIPVFRWFVFAILVVAFAGLAACSGGGNDDPDCDSDDPCVTRTPRITPPPTHTPAPTSTPGPTSTPTPKATATAAPNACLPSSSIGILVQSTNVTAYAPKGSWGSCGPSNGISVVPIETSAGLGKGGPATPITTTELVNSCSSNSDTGQTVCVANSTHVFLVSGTTLKSTSASGATGSQTFSGGNCMNCGVVVDSSTNRALITIGLTGTGGPGGYQFLDLGATPPTFETPIPAGAFTSEDASIDPVRKLVLSPNEQGNYQIIKTGGATPELFNNNVTGTPEFDSAGEDCTTGIALASDEFTGNLFIADLTQAKFTAGTGGAAGTWTAPSQLQNLFPGLAAGTNGVAVAPGTHFGVVTGEFGGALEGVYQLPSSSGTGTPKLVDSVLFTVPNDPSKAPWSMGCDPHTVTAYVSPNSHKAFAVLGNGSFTFLAVVDIEGMLKAPRTGGMVTDPTPFVTFIAQ
jgi:hypothetical protein